MIFFPDSRSLYKPNVPRGGIVLRFIAVALIGWCSLPFSVSGHSVSDPAAGTPANYTWQGGDGDWQNPGNWSPVRTIPSEDDVLVFSLGTATTVVNIPNQTIGQLLVTGTTAVNLQSHAAVILTIGGGDGHDLIVASGSTLNFNGSNAITANLVAGTTARINGSMTFSSSDVAGHQLTATDAWAITFESGSVFNAETGFTGNPFGTTNLNSVVFESGSTYICIAGGDPFGADEPDSVVEFTTGSLFSLQGNETPSFSGRTYANFELKFPGGVIFARGSSAVIMDDLTLTAGHLSLKMTGDPGHSIKGNIAISAGAYLLFSPSAPGGTINLNGTATQTISGVGQQGVDGTSTIVIDNPGGVFLNNRYLLAWNLELKNGVITTGPTWYVGAPGTVVRTNGYVNGALKRFFFAPGTFVFDVGTENGYSPVTVNVTAGDAFPRPMQIRPFQTTEPHIFDPTKALSRYWELQQSDDITADLTFHYLDPTDIPATANEGNFAVQKYNNGFTQPGGVVDTAANTFHITGVTEFARNWTLAEPGALVPPTPALFDFDGDGKTDISVFRPTQGAWYLQKSTEGFFGMLFGFGTDKITPADFDGDGKTDIAVFRPSDQRWYIANSADGTFSTFVYGLADDVPAPADYDGDGRADLCVFRSSDGIWYRQNSGNGTYFAYQFGTNGDKPTIGDFDGDGLSDIAVFSPSTAVWYQVHSSDGSIHGEQFGFSTDKIVHADYDGDGKTDIAVFRPSDRIWYIKNSQTSTYTAFVFGLSDDIPTPGDYDGDGRADLSVFRPSDGIWYRQNSGNGSYFAYQFGLSGDIPTPTAFH